MKSGDQVNRTYSTTANKQERQTLSLLPTPSRHGRQQHDRGHEPPAATAAHEVVRR